MKIDLDYNINNMEIRVDNKCKSFTSLKQSKKLAEILPLESADMYYEEVCNLSINASACSTASFAIVSLL